MEVIPLLPRIVAYPESLRVLRLHVAAAFCMGTQLAVITMLPFIARARFDADNLNTTILTAAVPVMQFFSLFWNHFYSRVSTRTYLLALAGLLTVPTFLLGLAPNVGVLTALFLISAFGNAGLASLNGDLLRSCYAPTVRGRAFGVVTTCQMIAALFTGLLLGFGADRTPDGPRFLLSAAAAMQFLGLALIHRISRMRIFQERLVAPPDTRPWWTPLGDVTRVLRADRRFAHYEIAFMSYGVGWMVCTALVPALATDRLHLNYSHYAGATIVLYQLTNVLMVAPMGLAVDRLGPMRVASISFLWLTIYPVGLLLASGPGSLSVLSVLYAMGMVGVQLTWTLGPVALAADASRASQYMAVHTTLVGVRGILAQGLGMTLYSLTGSFTVPFGLAAVAFLWASLRMIQLARSVDAGPLVAAATSRGATPAMDASRG